MNEYPHTKWSYNCCTRFNTQKHSHAHAHTHMHVIASQKRKKTKRIFEIASNRNMHKNENEDHKKTYKLNALAYVGSRNECFLYLLSPFRLDLSFHDCLPVSRMQAVRCFQWQWHTQNETSIRNMINSKMHKYIRLHSTFLYYLIDLWWISSNYTLLEKITANIWIDWGHSSNLLKFFYLKK